MNNKTNQAIQENKVNWDNVASLDDFEIIIHGASSILVEAKADVIFFYDKDKQKQKSNLKKLS